MNKRQNIIFSSIVLLVIGIVAVISIAGTAGDTFNTLRVAHPLDTSHPLHKSLEHFAQTVRELSDGKMNVLIYPNGQLGSDRQCLEQLQYGILPMTICSCGPLESFVPEMQIFGVPYIFRSGRHMFDVLNGPVGEELLSKGEKFGIKGLCFYDAGARSFYTKAKPIHNPDDLSGMKIRVMKTNMSIRTMKALGASPTPIDFGELYTALQQGVVDGAENNPPSFLTSMHYEICKYYSLDEHLRIPDALLISSFYWKKLSNEQKQIVRQAVKYSADYQKTLWRQVERQAIEKVQAAGVEIIYPDKEPFIDAVKPLWQSFEGTYTGQLIDKIQDVR